MSSPSSVSPSASAPCVSAPSSRASSSARTPVGSRAGYSITPLPVGIDNGSASSLQIGDQGHVIGQGVDTTRGQDPEYFGFVWDPQLGLCDLGWGRWPTSVNEQGLVGGMDMADEDSWQAFLWGSGTGLQDLGVPTDWSTFTLAAVNDAGQFAGTAENGGVDDIEPSEAFVWDPTTGWTGFGRDSGVQDLNGTGQVLVNVGGSDEAESDHDLYLWTPGDPPHDLGSGYYGMLNERGQAVWSTFTLTAGREQTYLWDPVTATREKVAVGHAYGLNDRGQVVGESGTPDRPRAFVWNAQDGLTELGHLPGAEWSTARGINSQGQVVGYSGTGPPGDRGLHGSWFHAFVWDQEAGMRDLGTLGESDNSEAVAINDRGHVVGWSGKSDGTTGTSAVIWAPASESQS
jgi:probable HAF family extracellular repeat protein